MVEDGPAHIVSEAESQNWSARAVVKLDTADDRYNNLFRSIEVGGAPMNLSMNRALQEHGVELSEEMEANIRRTEEFALAMQEAMRSTGVTAEMGEHFNDLRSKLNSLTESEYREMSDYIEKVEQVYQTLLQKGYSEKQIRQ